MTHIIHFATGIDANSISTIRNTILTAVREQATEIRIHMSSQGGNSYEGFMLFELLLSLPMPVVMHNCGNVESMAVVVFLAGGRRLACPHSRFLIHPMHWNFGTGQLDISRLNEFTSRLNDDAARYSQIFDERTKGAKSQLSIRQNLISEHKILTAEEALESGIVEAIEPAEIPTDAKLWWV